MSNGSRISSVLRTLILTAAVAAGPALADKPPWAGEKGGKAGAGEQKRNESAEREREHRDDRPRAKNGGSKQAGHFSEQHRTAVRDFYAGQARAGRCPPGLAKKQNGCMPPGQAKKWALGRPLPQDVVFHNVPKPLLSHLPPPPSGHRYVRVASDILMIAIGTALVVDAIEDLGR